MDTIWGYATPKNQHTSRHSSEKLVKALIIFYDKYTNTKIEKMSFTYMPDRLSDPEQYKHWLELEQCFSSWKPAPQETDEEISKNLNFIQSLDIISEKHREKTPDSYEKHEYEINISSFNELFSLVKMKNGTASSSYDIDIINKFNFSDYDYSNLTNIFKGYDCRNGVNEIQLYISNGVEFNRLSENECPTRIKLSLEFQKFTENEKCFLREIQKELKIKFSSKGFYYYYFTKKGKLDTKKEIVKL